MIWVDIFKLGTEVHRGGRTVEFTQDFAASLLSNFERLMGEGHEIVVLREHERTGHVFGQVTELRVQGDYVQALMSFYRAEDRDAFNNDQLRRFSPGFALEFEHPHTGEALGPTLLEVSFTAMPFQTNLRPPQQTNPGVQLALSYAGDTLTGGAMGAHETPDAEEQIEMAQHEEEEAPVDEEEAPFDMAAAFATLAEGQAQILSMLAMDPPAEEDEEELSDDATKIAALSARVNELLDTNTRLELSSAGIVEQVDNLVLLKRTDATLYQSMVELASKRAPGVQAPIGVTGTELTGAETLSRADIIELATKAGSGPGTGKLPLWVNANHPTRFNEITGVAE